MVKLSLLLLFSVWAASLSFFGVHRPEVLIIPSISWVSIACKWWRCKAWMLWARQELSSRVLYLHHLAAKWPFFALSSPTTHILAWLKYDNLDFTFFFTFFFLDSSLTNQAWNHSKIYSLHTSTQCWKSLILQHEMNWFWRCLNFSHKVHKV